MSRRSVRSSTAASSMATSVAIRQDRDAGAVKRLMTGKTLATAKDDTGIDGSAGTRNPVSVVPFTCYRCGQPLAGSLADISHPCLSSIEHAWNKPTTYTRQDSFAATPSGIPKENRDASSDPRIVEQVRSDLVKRGLPSSTDTSLSKRRRLTTDEPSSAPVRDKSIGEDIRGPDTTARSGAAVPIESVALAHETVGSQNTHVSNNDATSQEHTPSSKLSVFSEPVAGPVAAIAEEQKDSAYREETLQTNERLAQEDGEDMSNDLAKPAASTSYRRSMRGSTQAASKAAASLAYQQKHKAEIAREIQRCAARPATKVHGASLANQSNDGTFGNHQQGFDTNAQYEVELVRASRRTQRGELQYLVVWAGFPASDATWEPAANLADLEPDLFAFCCDEAPLPVPLGEPTEGVMMKPTVRGAGELSSACRRCECLGCGTRRLVAKGESKLQLVQQQGERDTSDARAAARGYSGSDSWPTELLGPKPAFPLGIDTTAGGSAENGVAAPDEPALNYLPTAVAQSLRGCGPCEHLEKGKLPAGWYVTCLLSSVDISQKVLLRARSEHSAACLRSIWCRCLSRCCSVALRWVWGVCVGCVCVWGGGGQDAPRPAVYEPGSHSQRRLDACFARWCRYSAASFPRQA